MRQTFSRSFLKKLAQALAMTPKRKSNRPFTVAVEGNIGSGKTTFLEYFKKYQNVCVLSEPVEMWRNCNGHNLLALLYQNPKQWCFSFQSYVQLTMLQQHMKPTNCPIKLLERSIYSAKYCFVEKMARDNTIPPPSAAVINEWFKWITENVDVSVDLIVYLRTTPEVVYDRVLKRSRQEEKTVSLEYLKEIHEMHEKWLYYKTLFSCPATVITLDANLDRSVIEEEYEKCRGCILNNTPIAGVATG